MRKRKSSIQIAAVSLLLLAGSPWAAKAARAAAPSAPSLTKVLSATGLSATGYVDSTFGYFAYTGRGAPNSYDSFVFQQAGLTLSTTNSSGFGALVNPIVDSYSPYAYNYAPTPGGASPHFYLFQAYASYASGPWTVIAGKFSTMAGAEVIAPPSDTNVTRSLLFAFEPLTHTGIRATYAANSKVSVTLGLNNGWFNAGDQSALGSGKTLEAAVSLTPDKMFAWTLDGYFGREVNLSGTTANLSFLDTVLTANLTSSLSLVGSIDWGQQDQASGRGTAAANWIGYAGYLNYAFNPQWSVSLRGEYFDDHDGYLTGVAGPLKEGTVTFAYSPVSHFVLRLEGRYDDTAIGGPTTSTPGGYAFVGPGGYAGTDVRGYEGWLEALFKF